MVESIVGFFLFSSILLLYLPAFYIELGRMDQIIGQTSQWQLFNDLVEVEFDNSQEKESKRLQQEIIVDLWEADHGESMAEFYCDEFLCLITFSEGSSLYVEIQEVQ